MNEPIQGRKPYSRLHGLPLVVAAIFVGLAGLLAAPESSAPVPDRPAVVEVTTTPETSEPPVTPPPVTPAPPVTPPPVTPAPVTISPEPVTPTPGEPTDPPFNPYYPPVTRPPVTPKPPVVDPTPTYKAPALNGVSSQMGNIDGAVDYFIYGFDLTHNDVDLEKGVSVTMQVRDIGASGWSTPAETYITVPTATYTGAGGAELTYNSEDIPIPTGEIGAIQEVQLVFDYTLTDGSTTGQIQSWDEGMPLYAYAGSYIYPGEGTTNTSRFSAGFPLDTDLVADTSKLDLTFAMLSWTEDNQRHNQELPLSDLDWSVSGGTLTVSGSFEDVFDGDPPTLVDQEPSLFIGVNYNDKNGAIDWGSTSEAALQVVFEMAPEVDSVSPVTYSTDASSFPFTLMLNDADPDTLTATLLIRDADGNYSDCPKGEEDVVTLNCIAAEVSGDAWITVAPNPYLPDGSTQPDPTNYLLYQPQTEDYANNGYAVMKIAFDYDYATGLPGDTVYSDPIVITFGGYLIPDAVTVTGKSVSARFRIDTELVDDDPAKFTAEYVNLTGGSSSGVEMEIPASDVSFVTENGVLFAVIDHPLEDGEALPPGDYSITLRTTYAGTIPAAGEDGELPLSWSCGKSTDFTVSEASPPVFGDIGHTMGVLYEEGPEFLGFPFELEINDAVQDSSLIVKLQYQDTDGQWKDLSSASYADGEYWTDSLRCTIASVPIPDGQAGALYPARLVCTYTFSYDDDPDPVISSADTPLWVFNGEYLTVDSVAATNASFRAALSADPSLIPSGAVLSLGWAEIDPNDTDRLFIPASGITVSGSSISLECAWSQLDPASDPVSGQLYVAAFADIYGDDTVVWRSDAQQSFILFTPPAPGTLTVDPAGGETQTVTAPLTLKSAQGGTVTAQLGELSDGAFHDLYGQTLSISGEESEVVSWTAQFEDFDLASLTEEDGCIVVPVVVRFGYEYSEYVDVPGEGPFSAYTDPLTLYYGNYLLGGEGTDEFYFNEEITAEFPLHEALPDPSGDTLSIVKVEVVSKDGEESVDVTDEAKAAGLSVEERDGRTVAVVSFTTEKELFLGYCRLMVTLSYTDDDIAGWQSASFADLDLMEPQQSYTAPIVTAGHGMNIGIDAPDQLVYPFTVTLNDAVLDTNLRAVLQYSPDGGTTWTSINGVIYDGSAEDGKWSSTLTYDTTNIPAPPAGENGALYDVRVLCYYTLPDTPAPGGPDDLPFIASTEALYMPSGSYLSASGDVTYTDDGFEARFTIDSALLPSGAAVYADGAFLSRGDYTYYLGDDAVAISGTDVTVTGKWSAAANDQGSGPWELQVRANMDLYGDSTDSTANPVWWYADASRQVEQSVTFTAPVPGTLSMEHIDNDDKDQHIINVTAPLTLNSAEGGQVTAELGWAGPNGFHRIVQTAPAYGGSGDSWRPTFAFDAKSAAEDTDDGVVIQPAVARFTYTCPSGVTVPADDPGYVDSARVLLCYGNYIQGVQEAAESDSGGYTTHIDFTESFLNSEYIDLEKLSIVSVFVLEEDDSVVAELDQSMFTLFVEDEMAEMRFSLPNGLYSGSYRFQVTLSYTDEANGVYNWTSTGSGWVYYESDNILGDGWFSYNPDKNVFSGEVELVNVTRDELDDYGFSIDGMNINFSAHLDNDLESGYIGFRFTDDLPALESGNEYKITVYATWEGTTYESEYYFYP